MKKVLAWVKSNFLIVLFSAIIVITLPAAYVGSSMFGKSVRTKRETEASELLKKVENAKLGYQLPSLMPGGEELKESRVPNKVVSEFYEAQRKSVSAASKKVIDATQQFNQGKGPMAAAVGREEHKPLVEGLFPKPADASSASLLTNRFVDLLVDRRDKRSVYARMLREVLNAGDPVDLRTLAARLESTNTSERQKASGGDAQAKLSDDIVRTIENKLITLRRDAYLQKAQEISVYAGMEIFPTASGAPGGAPEATIPKEIPSTPPSVSQTFRWQMDYWLIRDLLTAVRVANTTTGGSPARLNESVVKRIEKITIREPFGYAMRAVDSATGTEAPAQPAMTLDQLAGLVPTDKHVSVTGRMSSPQNPLYDVRTARLEVIVSATRVKQLIDALSRTNLMTVIGVNLSAVDVMADLERGYYYGDENVVRAEITVETIWLRSWTEPLFPSGIRQNLGLSLPEGEKPDEAPAALDGMGVGDPAGSPGFNPGPSPEERSVKGGNRGG